MNSNCFVHGGWIENTFFIWGECSPNSRFEQKGNFQYPFLYSPFELKLRLFRNDKISYYGTFIEEGKAVIKVPIKERQYQSFAGETTIYQATSAMKEYPFPIEGLLLSLESIYLYLSLFKRWQHDRAITLTPDIQKWLRLFSYVEQMIADGHFEPDPNGKWQLIQFPFEEWYDALPDAAKSVRPASLHIQSNHEGLTYTDFQKLIRQLSDSWIRSIVQRTSIAPYFLQWLNIVDPSIEQSIKQLQTNREKPSTITVQDFNVKAGITTAKPFLSGLVLEQPKTEDGEWTVSLCMIDRKHPTRMVKMQQLELGEHPWHENPIAQLKQDVHNLRERIPLLHSLRLSSPTLTLSAEEAFYLFTNEDEMLQELGFHLIIPKWMSERPKPKVSISLDHDLIEKSSAEPLLNWQSVASFTYQVAIGNEQIDEKQFKQIVEEQKPFVYINGEWIAWDRSLAETLKSNLEEMKQRTSYLEAWKLDQTNELNDQFDHVDVQIEWQKELEKALNQLYTNSPPSVSLSDGLHGELRPYQHDGVSWLVHLRHIGFGGCLADDMGLGKSIQTIAYFLHVIDQQEQQSLNRTPFLLICPTSLLQNWIEECQRFAPSLTILIHHGSTRISDIENLEKWDLIISTYQLMVKDEDLFASIRWNGLVLDEAQHIKNIETKQRRAIKKIDAIHRIALTGTPIENRLRELWSLLDVLNPSFLGSYYSFQSNFMKPIEQEQNQEQLHKLQALIRPFLLRRTKADESLALNLPAKNEIVHPVYLSVEQASLYQAVVEDMVTRLNEDSALERRAHILQTLTKLKQICNHPAHFLKEPTKEHQSGKWDHLLSLVEDMYDNNEKVLIFTQYKEMGRLIVEELEKRYTKEVPFLHGSLTRAKRTEVIELFQQDAKTPFFVLSLKAGGVGLNLTAASHVIHYDRWWNPAVENQATDRAYRIGQTKDVTVHKLMTTGTLEERIDRLLSQKQELANHILAAGEQRITELSNDEILELVKLS
ncbi:DEAD/DEAH box helicase [Halalkalibacter sp. AB-rgal2]|uniref:DEAD/DEAH box helicase n=1 Tax=Halalkalibacter sp. AB-rgal2 TaxID=3242695 RepID=UPI00359DE725